jgi:hypothetical protein
MAENIRYWPHLPFLALGKKNLNGNDIVSW